jgi:PAS domain S-box-containing protein
MLIPEASILAARILVVCDPSEDLASLEEILRRSGHTDFTSTTHRADVCALHRQEHFQLVLLDLQAPDAGGFELIETLRGVHGDPRLPVLAIVVDPVGKLRALAAGVRDFIGKPFEPAEVNARIHNAVEVRLLYRRVREHDERAARLRESEARYRSLTELASDWYWEQDESGRFTKVSGPVLEMLGIRVDGFVADGGDNEVSGWDESERTLLRASIAAREPFLDFVFSRRNGDGTQQKFQVSGEPMFGHACQFIGYRGVGIELRGKP